MTRSETREIQKELSGYGYYHGRIDGLWGPLTRSALALMVESRSLLCRDLDIPRPHNRREVEQIFGLIEYRDKANGWVTITNDFAHQNIVRADLPIVGPKRVHRLLHGKFEAALSDLEHDGLASEIRTFGTTAYRHILNRANKPLSLHSYGIAVDINARENPYGQRESLLHPEIVKVFEQHGFRWGGYWRTPDPMHFEYKG